MAKKILRTPISDEDLNRMYEEFLQSKDSKSSSIEHEYGGY